MEQQPRPRHQDLHVHLPADQSEGHYADFASVWHVNETFVLDFAAMTQAPTATRNDRGEEGALIKSQVVARVRIPVSQVWELMKALEKQLGAWEAERATRSPGSE